jgi:hypothetical protein
MVGWEGWCFQCWVRVEYLARQRRKERKQGARAWEAIRVVMAWVRRRRSGRTPSPPPALSYFSGRAWKAMGLVMAWVRQGLEEEAVRRRAKRARAASALRERWRGAGQLKRREADLVLKGRRLAAMDLGKEGVKADFEGWLEWWKRERDGRGGEGMGGEGKGGEGRGGDAQTEKPESRGRRLRRCLFTAACLRRSRRTSARAGYGARPAGPQTISGCPPCATTTWRGRGPNGGRPSVPRTPGVGAPHAGRPAVGSRPAERSFRRPEA